MMVVNLFLEGTTIYLNSPANELVMGVNNRYYLLMTTKAYYDFFDTGLTCYKAMHNFEKIWNLVPINIKGIVIYACKF